MQLASRKLFRVLVASARLAVPTPLAGHPSRSLYWLGQRHFAQSDAPEKEVPKPQIAEVKPAPAAEKKPEEKKPAEKSAGKKKKKQGKQKKGQKQQAEVPAFPQLDIRVGKITAVTKHPDSTKLYLTEVDIGNGEIRKIAAGLQQFIKPEDLLGKCVVVFCNVRERSLAGYPSHGMILCASDAEKKNLELLVPPEGAKAGDPVTVEGLARSPAADLNIAKKNSPWAKMEGKLLTDADLVVKLEGKPLRTDKGAIRATSLKSAIIT